MDDDSLSETTNNEQVEVVPLVEVDKKIVRWCAVHQNDGPSPRPRHGHRAVAVNDLIVIFGGGNEGMIDELHAYNTTKKEWLQPQVRGDAPPPSAAFGAAAIGMKIYTFGGMTEYGKYSNDVYELQATRWEWRRLNTKTVENELPPAPRLGHSFIISPKTEKAYVFGGLCNELNDNKRNIPLYMNDFHVLNLSGAPNAVVWEKPTTLGTSPKPRESHSAVLYETENVSRMVVYGGMNGIRLGDLWYLDLNSYEWTEVKFDDPRNGIPPTPRSLHSCVLIKEKMFVFGGWVPILHEANDDQSDKEWKCTDSLNCFDVAESRWIPLRHFCTDDAPRARSGHCAAAMGDRMYIWSGRDGYRKAWSNQVCCRDMWLLETMKPQQPGKVNLNRALPTALEVTWPTVAGAIGYFLQIGFANPKDTAANSDKPGQAPALKPNSQTAQSEADKVPRKPSVTTPSLISTQGTTYTAPAPPKPAVDEGGLPQDLFEDPEKNEANATSPKTCGDAGGSKDEKKTENADGSSDDSIKKDADTKASNETKAFENDDDSLLWFDVGILKGDTINITHYFNHSQQSLDSQIFDLIDNNAFKTVNDPCFTVNHKVPLVNGQGYRFRVAAINGLGKGPWSELATYKTCSPGFPSAPSSIRITKSIEGAQLTWEPPANTVVSGKIMEYSVYLAVKNQSANPADSQLAFMRVYCGVQPECQVPQANLGTAYVDQTTKPAIIFRIAARNERGYGPATQVRWLQDQQKMPAMRNSYPNQHLNTGYLYQPPVQQKRARYEHH